MSRSLITKPLKWRVGFAIPEKWHFSLHCIDGVITNTLGFPKVWIVGEYQNKVKSKFSSFLRQHFPSTDPGRF